MRLRNLVGRRRADRSPIRGRAFGWVVAIAAGLGLLAGVMWSASGAPQYVATATAFVGFHFPADQQDPFSGSQFVLQRIDSYAELAQTPQVLNAVATEVGGPDVEDLRKSVTVSAAPGTVLLRVTVKAQYPQTAAATANSVLSNLANVVSTMEGAAGQPMTSPVEIVSVQPAFTSVAPWGLANLLKPLAGLCAGAILGFVIGRLAFTRSHDDDPLSSSDGSPNAPGDHPQPDHIAVSAFDTASVGAQRVTRSSTRRHAKPKRAGST